MADSITSSTPIVNAGSPGGDYQVSLKINATPDAVYDALTSITAIEDWWVPVAGNPNSDGELIFQFGDSTMTIHVDEANRAARVRWNVLDCAIMHDWDGTIITFNLSPARENGTQLDFRHHGLTPQLECFEICNNGWAEALGKLINHVETGHAH